VPSQRKDAVDGSKILEAKPLPAKPVKEAPKTYTSLRLAPPESLLERKNRDLQGKTKLEELEKLFMSSGQVKTGVHGVNTSKIQKFIEKQKKRNAAKKTQAELIEHDKAMKVHQNLVNLHNFTLKERLKHNKDAAFFTIKRSTQMEVGKKRKSSLEGEHSSTSERQGRQRKPKIQPLRIRPKQKKQSTDLDHDMLDDTIQMNSSRNDVDNSIINIYRRASSSKDSKVKSALRSSSGDATSPYRRSLSGGRQEHPPLRVLKKAQFSPTRDPNDPLLGSAYARRKQQE